SKGSFMTSRQSFASSGEEAPRPFAGGDSGSSDPSFVAPGSGSSPLGIGSDARGDRGGGGIQETDPPVEPDVTGATGEGVPVCVPRAATGVGAGVPIGRLGVPA